MKSGIKLLAETVGSGDVVQRQHVYQMQLKMWLNQGQAIVWQQPWGMIDGARLEDGGQTMITDLRVDRENLFNGLFYGIEGMRIGGMRKLKVSPQLAYGERGIKGLVPANAVIIVEVTVLEQRQKYPLPG
jgi:FKBP-type peptidyl-prolyl cis-trans isomerase 2